MANRGDVVSQRYPTQPPLLITPSAAIAATAGNDRRSARPHASAIAPDLGRRDHTEPGRRRFLCLRTVSRDDAGGVVAGRAAFAVPWRRDRSMIRKYACRDHRGNFLAALPAPSADHGSSTHAQRYGITPETEQACGAPWALEVPSLQSSVIFTSSSSSSITTGSESSLALPAPRDFLRRGRGGPA